MTGYYFHKWSDQFAPVGGKQTRFTSLNGGTSLPLWMVSSINLHNPSHLRNFATGPKSTGALAVTSQVPDKLKIHLELEKLKVIHPLDFCWFPLVVDKKLVQ